MRNDNYKKITTAKEDSRRQINNYKRAIEIIIEKERRKKDVGRENRRIQAKKNSRN